jgi:hypothetical protein
MNKQIRIILRQRFGIFVFMMFLFVKGLSQDTTITQQNFEIDTTGISDSLTTIQSVADTINPIQVDTAESFSFRKIENNAFDVGENLIFEIAYGFVVAGTARMSIPDTQRVNGRLCYHIVTKARSSKFFSVFFKVRDRVESFIDVEGIFPWKFEKHLREGSYRADRYTVFDQINQRVFYKKDTLEAPRYVQDVLSSFYYTRTVDLEVGESVSIENHSGRKIYPLKILVHRKERIKVPAGTFNCIVVEPVLKGEGLFKHKGKLKIWLTDDERKMPVLMRSKALIGSIDVRLKAFRL